MTPKSCDSVVSCGIRTPFGILSPCEGQVTHALLTRPPLEHSSSRPKSFRAMSPLDLHVLGTPPAFVLSQDQTLPFNPLSSSSGLSALALSRLPAPDSQDPLGIRCLFDCASFSIPCRISCIVFKVRRPRRSFIRIPKIFGKVNTFFQENAGFFRTFPKADDSCRIFFECSDLETDSFIWAKDLFGFRAKRRLTLSQNVI